MHEWMDGWIEGRVGKYTHADAQSVESGVKKPTLETPPLSLSHSVVSHSDLINPGL